MATELHLAAINRYILNLEGNESYNFTQGEEYNSVIAVKVIGGGTLAVTITGLPENPLKVVTSTDKFGCKAPNITFALNTGSATIIIDRKRVRYDG